MQHDSKPRHNGQDDTGTGLPGLDQALSPAWLAYTPGNWSWAERTDRAEEQAFRCIDDARRKMIANAEKAMANHMDFVSHRFNADLDCLRQLTTCRLPDETMRTLQDFMRTMWQDYENLAQRTFAMMQDSVADGVASAEAITGSAVETVAALESAAEEEVALTEASAGEAELAKEAVLATAPASQPAPVDTYVEEKSEAVSEPAKAVEIKAAPARSTSARASASKAPARRTPRPTPPKA